MNQNSEKIYKVDESIYDVVEQLKLHYNLTLDTEKAINNLTLSPDETEERKLHIILESLGFKVKSSYLKRKKVGVEDNPIITRVDEQFQLTIPDLSDEQAASPKPKKQKYTGHLITILGGPHDEVSAHTDHIVQSHALDWFWAPIIYFRQSYYEILAASIFINLFVLALPIYSLNVYDRVILNFAKETLIVLTLGVIFALSFDFVFKTIRSYILERLAERLSNDYDLKLMQRLVKIENNALPLSVGEQSNLFRELQSIREFYAGKLVPTLIDIPFILLFILIIYFLSPVLALIPLVMAAIILAVNFFAHLPISRISEEYFSATQKKVSFLVETLSGIQTLKMFNADTNRLFHWNNSVSRASRVTRRNNFIIGAVSTFTFMLSQFSHVLVVYFGVYEIQDENLTIGGLIACTILSSRVIAPILNLSSLLARLKQSHDLLVAIDRIFKYPHQAFSDVLKATKGPFEGNIQLRNMSYSYEDDENKAAVKNANLTITSGEKVGIIGQTAAGKTTLVKVMAGLLKPQQGSVLLDNYAYDAISEGELRDAISYAPQDPFFFRGSVLYNITLGRENITKNALEQALDVSGLLTVLKTNAQGIDMDVGEGGCHLSGGQKQALSLARAIVCDPQILIFDEPTTGMDTMLENYIQVKLKEYIADRNFIMITHRTSLLSLVDRLVLMNGGTIVADGPKDEILKKLSG